MEDLFSQLLSLLRGAWRYRWYAVAVAWLLTVSGWVTVFNLRDEYQSSARVYVDTHSILKPLLAGMTSLPDVEQQVSIMSRTLLSRPNVERVMRMVDLDINATTPAQREEIIAKLTKQLKIAGTIRNDIYTISYTGENPKLTRDVVQSLLTIFVEGGLSGKKQDSEKAIQFIDEQIKTYEEKLAATENALKEFKIKNVGMLPKLGGDYGSKLIEATENLNRAKLELAEAEQTRDTIKMQIARDASKSAGTGAVKVVFSDPDLDSRIQAVNKQLDNLRVQYTENHPDIVSGKRLLAQLEKRRTEAERNWRPAAESAPDVGPVLQQLKLSLTSAEASVASLRVRVKEYQARVAKLRAMSVAAPELETQLAQLNRDYKINKDNYEKFIASREAAKLSSDVTASTEMMTFRVVDPPTMPLKPTGPNRVLFTSATLVGGLLAGIGAAMLLSLIRPTFLSPATLQEVTGLKLLGSVSVTWGAEERKRRRKGFYLIGASILLLLIMYFALIARLTLHA